VFRPGNRPLTVADTPAARYRSDRRRGRSSVIRTMFENRFRFVRFADRHGFGRRPVRSVRYKQITNDNGARAV